MKCCKAKAGAAIDGIKPVALAMREGCLKFEIIADVCCKLPTTATEESQTAKSQVYEMLRAMQARDGHCQNNDIIMCKLGATAECRGSGNDMPA